MSRPYSTESPYRAISHSLRRKIIQTLRGGERTVGELLELFSTSRPNLTQHLRILRETGLISYRRRGPYLVYRLQSGNLREPRDWLAALLKN